MAKTKVSDLAELKSKSEAELNQMIANDEIELGTDEENKTFVEFSRMSEDDRAKMLNGETVAPSSEVPVPEVPTQATTPEITPAADPVAPAPAATPESVTGVAGNFAGYSTLDELQEAHKKLQEQLSASERRHRSTNSRLGAENVELKKQIEAMKSTPAPAPAQAPAAGGDEIPDMPILPVAPNPEEFADGLLDEKYVKQYSAYTKSMQQYNEQVKQYNAKMRSIDSVIRKRIEPDLSEVRSLREQIQNKERESSKEQAWGSLWSDVESIQDKYGLKTSVPVKVINEYTAQATSSSASPEDREAAQRFLDTLPKQDVDAFGKLSEAMNNFYDFSAGVPQKRFKTFEGFLYESGMNDSFRPAQSAPIVAQAPVAPQQQQQYAQAMPASAVGSSDVSTRGYGTHSEAMSAYERLSDEAIRYPGEFNRNPAKVKELQELEARFGLVKTK